MRDRLSCGFSAMQTCFFGNMLRSYLFPSDQELSLSLCFYSWIVLVFNDYQKQSGYFDTTLLRKSGRFPTFSSAAGRKIEPNGFRWFSRLGAVEQRTRHRREPRTKGFCESYHCTVSCAFMQMKIRIMKKGRIYRWLSRKCP